MQFLPMLLIGNTVPIITIREILIASLGLLMVPKSVKINITDVMGNGIKLLPAAGGRIEESKETIHKLNSVSETISEMAKSYNEVAVATIETEEDIKTESRKLFAEELFNNIEEFTDNILYEDLIDQDDIIIDNIYDILDKQETITKEELLQTFERNNSYIIGIDDEDKARKQEIENDISQMVKAINYTYRINKMNLIWKQKEASNKKTLANQLGGVSRVISSLAEDIEDIEAHSMRLQPTPKYRLKIGISRTTKNKSEISGDSSVFSKLNDGKYMIAISDGMGSRTKC